MEKGKRNGMEGGVGWCEGEECMRENGGGVEVRGVIWRCGREREGEG